jgi:hypothetical protein
LERATGTRRLPGFRIVGQFRDVWRRVSGVPRVLAVTPLEPCLPVLRLPERGRFQFLTQAQRKYVEHYCSTLSGALESGEPGEYVIDMDAVADAAGKDSPKPAFYYAEEQQQNLFTCRACGGVTNVLGTYAYCSLCATRNDLQELEERVRSIRERANTGGPYEAYVSDAVAGFDSVASQYAKHLMTRVPLARGRLTRLQGARYHNLGPAAEAFKSIFRIDILEGLDEADRAFATRAFHRRYVYEHKGGEADEKYIADSGDDVRPKQALRETPESANRTARVRVTRPRTGGEWSGVSLASAQAINQPWVAQ